MLKRLIVLLVFLLTIPQFALALGRVDTEGATVDNKFTEGNQALAEPATVLGAAWLNDIQEELVGIVEASGQTPAKGSQGQLKQALIVKVPTIADLRDLTPNGSMTVQVLGYYSPGDGGGGPVRRGVSGAALGTYVDDGGEVIVPTGGDGSAAWLWEHSGPVNIKWYGATGDEGAANAFATSDVVFWPAGSYSHAGLIDVPAGKTAIGYSASITGPGFNVKEGGKVTGFVFDGTSKVSGDPWQGVWIEDSGDVEISGNTFIKTILYQKSTDGPPADNVKLLNNTFKGDFTGLTLGNCDTIRLNGIRSGIVAGNIFNNLSLYRFIKLNADFAATTGQDVTVLDSFSSKILITENIFNGSSAQTGIDLFNGTSEILVSKNIFNMQTTNAVSIKPGEPATGPGASAYSVKVSDNWFMGSYSTDVVSMQGPYGMTFYTGESLCDVSGNIFTDDSDAVYAKISVRGFDSMIISGNQNKVFTHTGAYTFIVGAASRTIKISDNVGYGGIVASKAASTAGGLPYDSNCESITIDGNTIRDAYAATTTSPIQVDGYTESPTLMVRGNTLKTTGLYAGGLRGAIYIKTSVLGKTVISGNITTTPEASTNGLGSSNSTASPWLVDGNSWQIGTTLPTASYWPQGARFYYTNAAAGGKVGAVNIAAGYPGTFKGFGAIDP
jgi:hypothetical protein